MVRSGLLRSCSHDDGELRIVRVLALDDAFRSTASLLN